MKTISKILTLAGILGSSFAYAQQADTVDLYSLSLEELLNIPINSASKKDETVFDAPLSSYTITRGDIQKAGSTSIMEALRLAPGVIVREQTNGVYDIHIRGFDNILRTSEDYTKSNLATLVMIDNRPVFNHNLGGTFWESLPIDLNDVERIEIVRGPSAPLFGPNAVTGVINIITKRASSKYYTSVNAQLGTPNTKIANASYGMKVSDKFNFVLSGNYQDRERFDTEYYNANPVVREYQNASAFITNANRVFPDLETSLNRKGGNAFVNYKPSDKVSFDLSLGAQASETQKHFLSGATFFTTNISQSQYANLGANIYGLTLRSSYTNGYDNLNVGSAPSEYDYKVADVMAEYEIAVGKRVSVVPGVSYQTVRFSDADYLSQGTTFLSGNEVSINTTAGFLRVDAKATDKLRIIGAIRADKFSVPDDIYFAYEFATTFKINAANIIRAAVTRSNSGSFIGTRYLDLSIPIPALGTNYRRTGTKNLDLFTVNMIELGYRVNLAKNLQLDVDLFNQKADHYNALLVTEVFVAGQTVIPTHQEFRNVPTSAVQNGVTLSLNYVPNDKIQVKPFITVQKTETKDLASSYVSTSVNPGVTYSDSKHENTPSFYGGYYINYKPVSSLNFNLNGYYFAAHRQYDGSDLSSTSAAGDIKGKFLVNLKANWAITKSVNVFFNGRNIFNNDSREMFGLDRIGGLYSLGASFQLN